jgi:hypothetical protein
MATVLQEKPETGLTLESFGGFMKQATTTPTTAFDFAVQVARKSLVYKSSDAKQSPGRDAKQKEQRAEPEKKK